jgi:ubiquinone/menaquinone biosynthesis C-methylase UbiE
LAGRDEYAVVDPYGIEVRIESEFHRRRVACTLELLAEAAARSGHVRRALDLACGQGHITARIKDRFPATMLSALDHSVSAIESAVHLAPGVEFVVADAYCMPYSGGFFDAVVCNNFWEHVQDPLRLLREISRVLSPSGWLVLSTPSRYRLGNILRILRGQPVMLMSRHHVTEYSIGQVEEQLAWGGYEVIRVMSRSVPAASWRLRLALAVIGLFARAVGRSHVLESTIFYLARRQKT